MSLDEGTEPTASDESPMTAATGFDARFLGVDAAMPRLPEARAVASIELDYVHFTVVHNPERRFAAVTGVNIDGAHLVTLGRDDRWVFDERIPADLQAGPDVYANNDLDRGHLVRRNDPVWGSPEVAARANTDTFRFTNAAPQASGFNQSRELWVGLEDHVLEHARVHDLKLSVFTGPVFADDERIPADLQAGPDVYANNDLDRGHLVRRNDPVWGSPEVAARANTDTFRFTNAAPQASGFNQSRELWVGLEDHVLEHARVHDLKLSVFTGPVFADDDPPYRGIRIPLKFWKIAAWSTGDALATTGFVVDQSPLVDIDKLPRAPGGVPPLGPFRTFQVPIAEIVALTGLVMPELAEAEHLPRSVAAAGWRPITSSADILV